MSWIVINDAFRLGLSTDARPTDGLRSGVRIYELDTQNTYLFTGLPAPLDWVPWKMDVKMSAGDVNIGNVDIASLPALVAGEAYIGQVGSWSDLIVVTPTIAAAAFSSGDVVGGKLTITGAVRVAAGKGKITGLKLVDASKQKAPLLVFIFSADLAGTYADNAAEAVTAADWLKWIGTIKILAADYEQMANAALVDLGFDLDVEAAAGTSLYALIVTTGTPTYGANALQLTFAVGEGS